MLAHPIKKYMMQSFLHCCPQFDKENARVFTLAFSPLVTVADRAVRRFQSR
jgi:hypothetical protein